MRLLFRKRLQEFMRVIYLLQIVNNDQLIIIDRYNCST